eukprot:jgi/Mesvir1/26494/Mv16158-RA.3
MSQWVVTMASRTHPASVQAGCLLPFDHPASSKSHPGCSSRPHLSNSLRLPGGAHPGSAHTRSTPNLRTRVTMAILPTAPPPSEDIPSPSTNQIHNSGTPQHDQPSAAIDLPPLLMGSPSLLPRPNLPSPHADLMLTASRQVHGRTTATPSQPRGRSLATAAAVALALALGGGMGLVQPPPAFAAAAATAAPATKDGEPAATATAAAVNEKVVAAGDAARVKSEAAEKRILAELEKNPKHEGMLRALLRLRMEREDLKGSIEPLERLTELRPDDIELAMILGQAQIAMHNLPAAGDAFQKVLAADPFNPAALQGSVAILQHANKGDQAVALLRDTLAKAEAVAAMAAPTSQERRLQTELVVGVKLVLGQVLVSQGDLEAACLEYNDCVKAVPNDFRPYLSLGFVHSLSGNTKKAEESFAKSKALCPPNYREVVDQLVSAAQKGVKIEHALKNKVK